MKELLKILGAFALLVTAIPLVGLMADSPQSIDGNTSDTNTANTAYTEGSPQASSLDTEDDETFLILNTSDNTVTELSMTDYIIGAVMGEMPASYETEALKAQAVAVHTYAVRRIISQKDDPDPNLLGAYVSDDPCKYQAYFTEEQARAFYGSDYEEYYEKVASAVSAVRSEIITYEGEPIAAAFHAVSSGKTESAENIWGFSAGYLVPVSSPWDETAEGFLSINTFTYDELYTRLASAGYAADENADKSELITDVTESGTVKKMQICGVTITGMELREILSLKSPVFEAEYDSTADSYIFTVKGSGHGVGMSQYGANSMAQDGYTYRDILEHYYTGVEVTEWAGMA